MSVQLDLITYNIELDIDSSGNVAFNIVDGITVYANGVRKGNVRALDFRDEAGNQVSVVLSNNRALVYLDSGITFSNGLTKTLGVAKLGGTLSQNTTIEGAGLYDIVLGNAQFDDSKTLANFQLGVKSTGVIQLIAGSNILQMSDASTGLVTTGAISLFGSTTALLRAGTTLTLRSSVGTFAMTTVGGNLFSLTNPSAVTWPRLNADNTVTALSANATMNAILPSKTGNALKVLRVNAGETDYELATVSGGSSSLATLTDVTLTGLAANDFLKYNGSVWINRTPANVRTDLGLDTWTNLVSTVTGTAPYRGLNGTYTATGNITDAFDSNTWGITTTATTGTFATLTANSLTTGTGLSIVNNSGNTYTSGKLLNVSSSSTELNHTAGTNSVGYFSVSGAQNNSGRTGIALSGVSSISGTSSTGIGLYGESSGATINYALKTGAGLVNFAGYTTIDAAGSNVDLFTIKNSGSTTHKFQIFGGIPYFYMGNSSNQPWINPQSNGTASLTGLGWEFVSYQLAGANTTGFKFSNASTTTALTSGNYPFVDIRSGATASSGTGTYIGVYSRPTFNTTGTYSGELIGFLHDPTNTSLTGASDYSFKSTSGSVLFVQNAKSANWLSAFKVTPGAHTGLTAATEFVSADYQGATQTWADGTVATQRFAYFRAFTLNKTTTSATFTNAYRAYFEKSVAGTGVTITNNYALGLDGDLNMVSTTSAIRLNGSSGTSGQALTSAGAGATPTWTDPLIPSAINVVSPTAQNRTVTIVYQGTTLYLTAKTTND